MKKKWLAVVGTAVFICAIATAAWANQPIKLVVNGQEIKSDVSPQMVGNRTMVPVRWIAEALGAEVEWDAQTKTVFIRTNTSSPENQTGSDAAAIAKLVEDFGRSMKNVSLLAPEDEAAKSIQETYGDFVSSALLAQWQKDPQNAPGRVSSSPWPEGINIIATEKLSDSKYQVKGEIIEMTSVEMTQGGYAAKRPVSLTAEKINSRWLITALKIDGYEQTDPTVYRNTQYGFSFQLPESWQGYTVVLDQWEGLAIDSPDTVAQTGPLLSIRHPQWTSENPRQDIPIMVLTLSQWNAMQQEEFHIGAAPIKPSELGRNSRYVFALPARYNYAFPAGYEEVEKILAGDPLQPLQ